MIRVIALAALSMVAVAPAICAETYHEVACRYFNTETGKALDSPCTLETAELNGHFGYVLKFPDGTSVTVEYVNSQGPDHIWKINGQPAYGFEINREHIHGATLDLNQSVEWRDRASKPAASAPTSAAVIASFSGNGISNTQPFTATGPWEVQWNATGPFFSIALYSPDGNVLGVLANQASGPGSSYFPTAGTYYLGVNTSAPWSAKIVPVN